MAAVIVPIPRIRKYLHYVRQRTVQPFQASHTPSAEGVFYQSRYRIDASTRRQTEGKPHKRRLFGYHTAGVTTLACRSSKGKQ